MSKDNKQILINGERVNHPYSMLSSNCEGDVYSYGGFIKPLHRQPILVSGASKGKDLEEGESKTAADMLAMANIIIRAMHMELNSIHIYHNNSQMNGMLMGYMKDDLPHVKKFKSVVIKAKKQMKVSFEYIRTRSTADDGSRLCSKLQKEALQEYYENKEIKDGNNH